MSFDKLKKENQDRILNAACEIFSKYGYEKASMKDIADTACVSKSVLFKYFSTKENLYRTLFNTAADGIRKADQRALSQTDGDIFSTIRKSIEHRRLLFQECPWIYRFSYTAYFDTSPFVQQLVEQEMKNYKSSQFPMTEKNAQTQRDSESSCQYKGLRKDISDSAARQIILWVSQSYLGEKLLKNELETEELEAGFQFWLDILEIILGENQGNSMNKNKGRKD